MGRPRKPKEDLAYNVYTYEKKGWDRDSVLPTWQQRISFAQLVDVFKHKQQCKKKICIKCSENEEWVQSDDIVYCYSFVECCHRVGVEADRWRKQYNQIMRKGKINENYQGLEQQRGDSRVCKSNRADNATVWATEMWVSGTFGGITGNTEGIDSASSDVGEGRGVGEIDNGYGWEGTVIASQTGIGGIS